MAKETKKKAVESASTKGKKEVALSTLTTLQQFKHEGTTYSVRRPHPELGIRVLTKDGKSLRWLPPDTLVTPI